jgi:hypothetical protein
MSQTLISAHYIPVSDHYNASISHNGKDLLLSCENGEDLADAIKNETGIEVEYERNSRKFIIPEENRLVI